MASTSRTTISVPTELWKQMRSFRGQVNWSQVASRAIEAKLFDLRSPSAGVPDPRIIRLSGADVEGLRTDVVAILYERLVPALAGLQRSSLAPGQSPPRRVEIELALNLAIGKLTGCEAPEAETQAV